MSPTGVRVNLSAQAKLSLSSESEPLKCELEKKVSYLKSAQTRLDIGSQSQIQTNYPSSYSTTTTITINNNNEKVLRENYPQKIFPFNLSLFWKGEPKKSLFNTNNSHCISPPPIKKGNFLVSSKTTESGTTSKSLADAWNNFVHGVWKWSRKFAPYWEFLIFPSEFHYVARVIIMTAVTVIVLHRTAISINYKQILESYHLDEGAPPGVVGINRNFY